SAFLVDLHDFRQPPLFQRLLIASHIAAASAAILAATRRSYHFLVALLTTPSMGPEVLALEAGLTFQGMFLNTP
ncbi:hypothetical protein, partial [Escherichia coli]|uniref:hypothetical protein n=1 Tax=Escherichia coli TaxID=562 RepID=UPI001BC88062